MAGAESDVLGGRIFSACGTECCIVYLTVGIYIYKVPLVFGPQVVAFTATQIPGIDDKMYPPDLAGELYPEGIPILSEDDLENIVKKYEVDRCALQGAFWPAQENVPRLDHRKLPTHERCLSWQLCSNKPIVCFRTALLVG